MEIFRKCRQWFLRKKLPVNYDKKLICGGYDVHCNEQPVFVNKITCSTKCVKNKIKKKKKNFKLNLMIENTLSSKI